MVKKWLEEKTKASKFVASQTEILTIAISILWSNFSWSKNIETMKFTLLIEYKMRLFFLKNLVLVPFIKIKIEHIAGSTFWNVKKFAFMICLSQVLIVQISKYWLLAFTSHESFLKNKGRSGTILPVTFSAWYLMENVSHFTCC